MHYSKKFKSHAINLNAKLKLKNHFKQTRSMFISKYFSSVVP